MHEHDTRIVGASARAVSSNPPLGEPDLVRASDPPDAGGGRGERREQSRLQGESRQTMFRNAAKDLPFVSIPNVLARNKALTFKARGMLVMLLSNKDDWQVHQTWLREQAPEGREAIAGAMQELEQHGYAVYDEVRKGGRIIAGRWTFYNESIPDNQRTNKTHWRTGENPPTYGKPCDGKPADGSPCDGESATKKEHREEEHSSEEHQEEPPNPQRGDSANADADVKIDSSKSSRKKQTLTDEEFFSELKANPAYRGIDIDREFGKMKAWQLTPKGSSRQITRRFIVNWLNKCEATVSTSSRSTDRPDTRNYVTIDNGPVLGLFKKGDRE